VFCNKLTLDFIGIEVGRDSLKSFTFQKAKDETLVLYEYSKRTIEEFDEFGSDLEESSETSQ